MGGDGADEPPDEAVVADVVISDEAHAGRGRMTVLRLTWHPGDPLAVELVLMTQPDHPALPRGRWVVLRDFVRYGLDQPTGDGEVRIRPDELRDRVWFELARPGRAASVSVPRGTARDFLDRTERVVPAGEERSERALDALLTRLLGA